MSCGNGVFDLAGELVGDLEKAEEELRDDWNAEKRRLIRKDAEYGELFRRALVVRLRMIACAAELEALAAKAAELREAEVAAYREMMPEELEECSWASELREDAASDLVTAFPESTADDLRGLAEHVLEAANHLEGCETLQALGALFEKHWGRDNDVNNPLAQWQG